LRASPHPSMGALRTPYPLLEERARHVLDLYGRGISGRLRLHRRVWVTYPHRAEEYTTSTWPVDVLLSCSIFYRIREMLPIFYEKRVSYVSLQRRECGLRVSTEGTCPLLGRGVWGNEVSPRERGVFVEHTLASPRRGCGLHVSTGGYVSAPRERDVGTLASPRERGHGGNVVSPAYFAGRPGRSVFCFCGASTSRTSPKFATIYRNTNG